MENNDIRRVQFSKLVSIIWEIINMYQLVAADSEIRWVMEGLCLLHFRLSGVLLLDLSARNFVGCRFRSRIMM